METNVSQLHVLSGTRDSLTRRWEGSTRP